MEKKKKKRKKRSPASKKRGRKRRIPLRDKIDPEVEINWLLADMELELYLQCMRLDKKRKKRRYII